METALEGKWRRSSGEWGSWNAMKGALLPRRREEGGLRSQSLNWTTLMRVSANWNCAHPTWAMLGWEKINTLILGSLASLTKKKTLSVRFLNLQLNVVSRLKQIPRQEWMSRISRLEKSNAWNCMIRPIVWNDMGNSSSRQEVAWRWREVIQLLGTIL